MIPESLLNSNVQFCSARIYYVPNDVQVVSVNDFVPIDINNDIDPVDDYLKEDKHND